MDMGCLHLCLSTKIFTIRRVITPTHHELGLSDSPRTPGAANRPSQIKNGVGRVASGQYNRLEKPDGRMVH